MQTSPEIRSRDGNKPVIPLKPLYSPRLTFIFAVNGINLSNTKHLEFHICSVWYLEKKYLQSLFFVYSNPVYSKIVQNFSIKHSAPHLTGWCLPQGVIRATSAELLHS